MAPAAALRKVRALLRLADPERGGTPAEREAAHAKAQALAGKHGIALDGLADLPDDLVAGERTVGITGPHRVWASILLMDVAAAFGVSLRLTADGATLAGPADDIARVARAHDEAWSSVHAGHDALMSALTPDARGARRYLHARYPDPSYHADVLGHLRYWPPARLERDVAAVLATSRGRARAIGRALRQGRVAPDDVAPSEAVSRGYFEAATFAIYWRLRDLQQARGQRERVEEPVNEDPAPPAPAAPTKRTRRPRRPPAPPPATAVAAGAVAGATSPIGLVGVDEPDAAVVA
jgi:hypothetical protein